MIGSGYALFILLGGFVLLTVLAMRGQSIFVAAPCSALAVLVLSGADPLEGMTGSFMAGFADYMQKFFLIFALGAAFGRLMEVSGAAGRVADAVVALVGPRWACLAVVLSCAVLTYGGVSLFVVGFSVYPLAVQLFRAADLPRRFIPAAIAFGSITFTMTTAGSPEIQNLIPLKYLVDARTGSPLSDARAGWPVSLFVAVLMFALGQAYLEWAIRRDRRRGARFEPAAGDPTSATVGERVRSATRKPGLAASLAPLVVTLAALNLLPAASRWLGAAWPESESSGPVAAAVRRVATGFPEDPTVSIFLGVAAALACLRRFVTSPGRALGEGFVNGLVAIGATSSVVGFGKAVEGLAAFRQVVEWVTQIPGDPLIGAAVAMAIIAGLAGSASGGQGLAWPVLKSIYVDQLGVPPRALHRVVAIASGSLDTLPANGYLVMLIRNICGQTHAQAYWPICVTCTIVPAVGTVAAIVLFKLVPGWAYW